MGKSITQIIAEMDAAQAAQSDLSGLTSTSSSAVHKLFKYVVAHAAVLLYKAWDAVLIELKAIIDNNIMGTCPWYVSLVKNYNSGTLVTSASCVENGTKVIIKVAKDVSGSTAHLTVTELNDVRNYVKDKKVAGTDVDVVSQTADLVDVDMSVQYTGTLAVVEADVIQAIKDHVASIPFDDSISKTFLVDAVQNVPGVLNAYVNTLKIDTGLGYVTVVGNTYPSDAGYFEIGKTTGNVDLINLTMYT